MYRTVVLAVSFRRLSKAFVGNTIYTRTRTWAFTDFREFWTWHSPATFHLTISGHVFSARPLNSFLLSHFSVRLLFLAFFFISVLFSSFIFPVFPWRCQSREFRLFDTIFPRRRHLPTRNYNRPSNAFWMTVDAYCLFVWSRKRTRSFSLWPLTGAFHFGEESGHVRFFSPAFLLPRRLVVSDYV